MKTYVDRLRECPIEMLKAKIKRQYGESVIIQHDLETMNRVLEERTSQTSCCDHITRKQQGKACYDCPHIWGNSDCRCCHIWINAHHDVKVRV